jgi:hypothetical protein
MINVCNSINESMTVLVRVSGYLGSRNPLKRSLHASPQHGNGYAPGGVAIPAIVLSNTNQGNARVSSKSCM